MASDPRTTTYRELLTDFEKQGAISRAWNSIRTRSSVVTAFLLLLALAAFYIGGRIVLVHLVRDTEQQVKEIGSDISRIAYKNAEHVRRHLLEAVANDGGANLAVGKQFSVCATVAADGTLVSGKCRNAEGEIIELRPEMLVPYAETLHGWCASTMRHDDAVASTGIIRLGGRSHYVALAKNKDGCMMLGIPFETNIFTSQVNEGLAGVDVKITNRKVEVTATVSANRSVLKAKEHSDFGIAPMFSEALDFYSGGFWDLGSSQYEALYAVRDIAGNAVTMVSVSIPKTLSSATQAAIGRLAFFVAVVGLIFVLPIFWFQSYVLLNPLSKMTEAIAELGKNHRNTDCPRLEWHGKDEFAMLAISVNRMLETIASRSLAVAQSESRQRAMIAAIPDALAVFDRQHRLVTMTKDSSEKNGIPFAVPGEALPDFIFGAEGKRAFEKSLDRAFAGEKDIEPIRLELQHAKWVPAAQPSRFFDLRVVKMDELFSLVLIRDISDMVAEHRKLLAATEKLHDGEKRQSLALLAAGIAHDINNLLTVIGNTTVATWSESTDKEEIRAVDTIGDALKRGSTMMHELMDYAGEARIVFERTSPRAMIADIENILRGFLTEAIELKIDVPEEIPDIDGGKNQLFKVFMNIVKNAVEAIGKRPGRIIVAARKFEMTADGMLGFRTAPTLKPGVGVLFTISDNGPGIKPEVCHRLFDPYVSTKAMGHGLGLATVASVIEAHGGAIRVDSVVERGTTFSIFFPESKLPKPAPAAKNGDGSAPAAATTGGEVLVVDDDESIVRTTSMLLKALKYTPRTAKNSAEALEQVRRYGSTLGAIILDAALDEVNTVRLAMAFRKNVPTVPIVISSGSTEEYIRNLYAEVKLGAILSKPYTIGELKATLSKVIGGAPA